MPKDRGTNPKQPSLDRLGLDAVCVCCEALTKVLVQKGIISWDELVAEAKTATIEREKCRMALER